MYRYLINNASFESQLEVVKKDAETGKIIPLSGFGFKIRDIETGKYITQHITYPEPMEPGHFLHGFHRPSDAAGAAESGPV